MEALLSLAFDNLTSYDGGKVRKGIRQVDGLLAQLCLSRVVVAPNTTTTTSSSSSSSSSSTTTTSTPTHAFNNSNYSGNNKNGDNGNRRPSPEKRRSVAVMDGGARLAAHGAAGGGGGAAAAMTDTVAQTRELSALKDDPAFREFFKLQDGFEWNGMFFFWEEEGGNHTDTPLSLSHSLLFCFLFFLQRQPKGKEKK